MNNKRVVLAGGSGFLGKNLALALESRGTEVIVLTRTPGLQAGAAKALCWDGRQPGPWMESLEDAEAVINLAGKSVNCRYSTAARREIIDSRVDSVKVLAEAVRRCSRPPRLWLQCSSLALYGDPGERWCNESSAAGKGFPAETCKLWEHAYNESDCPHTRKVLLRIGFVLGRSGGALKTLERLVRFGLGGRTGSGRQYISWIHWRDMNRVFLAALERPELEGVFNATSPEPVTNAEFMQQLRRALRRPWSPPTPEWAVHFGCWLMRTEPCLALGGRRCAPERLLQHGFGFQWPRLPDALNDLYAD